MIGREKLKTPNFTKQFNFLIAGSSDDIHEIQRQNRITEQILTNFFERKFFPHRKPRPAPTIDDILPPEPRPNRSNKHHQTKDEDDDSESDNLQSVESEHVDTFYRTSGELNF